MRIILREKKTKKEKEKTEGNAFSCDFAQICGYLSRFLNILAISISRNTIQWRLPNVVRFSKIFISTKKLYSGRKLGVEKT